MIQTTALIITILGGAMSVPMVIDFAYGNSDWETFFVSGTFFLFLGGCLYFGFKRPDINFSRRDVFILVPSIWLISCTIGAVPLYLSDLGMTFTDAFFESTSGLTTTGSTVLSGLDETPKGILMWRSMLQWIGGLGIIVLGLSLLPFMRSGGQQLFELESSDTTQKPFPRASDYAFRISAIYAVLSVSCTTVYIALGMTPFEALNHAMTTVSTGGFSTSDQSMGTFASAPMLAASTLFMIAGGIPFLLFINASTGKYQPDPQVPVYLLVILGASLFVFALASIPGLSDPADRIIPVVFNVVSIITTTGFASEDYLSWGTGVVAAFFFLTFIGGCAGSTAGGFKQFRLVVVWQLIVDTLLKAYRPNRIRTIKYGTRVIDQSAATSVMNFSFLYTGTFIAFSLVYALLGLDFETAISASATAIANVGPGIGGIIGPAGNFSTLSDTIKWMLCWEMIVGRLELVAIYILLLPDFWR